MTEIIKANNIALPVTPASSEVRLRRKGAQARLSLNTQECSLARRVEASTVAGGEVESPPELRNAGIHVCSGAVTNRRVDKLFVMTRSPGRCEPSARASLEFGASRFRRSYRGATRLSAVTRRGEPDIPWRHRDRTDAVYLPDARLGLLETQRPGRDLRHIRHPRDGTQTVRMPTGENPKFRFPPPRLLAGTGLQVADTNKFKLRWPRLARIRARVASSENAVSPCKYWTLGAMCASTPSTSEFCTARRRS